MSSRRQRQVAELLHKEISQILQHGTRDPRLVFVTVTGVEVTPDLKNATVHVTVLGDDEATKQALQGLGAASRYFRHQLGQTVSLRYIPELKFKLDTSLAYGLRIDQLLDEINSQYPPAAEPDEVGADPLE